MEIKKKTTGKTVWIGISPWFIIGAMVILAPIFIFMTLDNINKQRGHTIRIFMEKGDTLIRSFEAGVRTGMKGQQPDFFHLQKLLMEMAQQPDIDFITVVDVQGVILADSDPSLVGEYYGNELDLDRISRSGKIEWRYLSNPDGIDTFEVFRSFSPSGRYTEAPP
jgi:two-component system, NtrC family, sensor histidine kinase HydH